MLTGMRAGAATTMTTPPLELTEQMDLADDEDEEFMSFDPVTYETVIVDAKTGVRRPFNTPSAPHGAPASTVRPPTLANCPETVAKTR
jgi:hypothetical protein